MKDLARHLLNEINEVSKLDMTTLEDAEAFCRFLGFEVDTSLSMSDSMNDVQWDGRTATLRSSNGPGVIHELAHYMVATPARRFEVAFGLGSEPEGCSAKPTVGRSFAQMEEELASMLGILLERELGFNWSDTADEHGWIHPQDGGWCWLLFDGDAKGKISRLLKQLQDRGLIDERGKPLFPDFPWASA